MYYADETADNPQRVRLLVLRMLVLAAAVLSVFLLFSAAEADVPAPPTVDHVVSEGETLWGIAASVAAPGSDIRTVVKTLQTLNGLEDGVIYPGEVLAVPAT